jgi:hypothetical protein
MPIIFFELVEALPHHEPTVLAPLLPLQDRHPIEGILCSKLQDSILNSWVVFSSPHYQFHSFIITNSLKKWDPLGIRP